MTSRVALMWVGKTDSRTFEVRTRTWKIALGVCAAFLVVGLTGLGALIKSGYTWCQLQKNLGRRETLLSRCRSIQDLTGKYQQLFTGIVDLHDHIAAVYGFAPANKDMRGAGIGGPDVPIGPAAHLLRLCRQAEYEKTAMRSTYLAIADRAHQYRHIPMFKPAKGPITSGFGMRVHPLWNRRHLHTGIDIRNKTGTPVLSPARGTVVIIGRNRKSGLYLVINHGYGFKTLYLHLSQVLVTRGQNVKRFQPIAALGSSGLSTGPHLHYEVHHNGRPVDPQRFVHTNRIVFD